MYLKVKGREAYGLIQHCENSNDVSVRTKDEATQNLLKIRVIS